MNGGKRTRRKEEREGRIEGSSKERGKGMNMLQDLPI